jgi:PPPDE putative peptidase domain
MADELNDVILHVWKLPVGAGLDAAQNNNNNNRSASSSSWGGFLDRFLPNVGLGAYHTCLEYDHSFYTFSANVGVVKSSSNRQLGMPNAGQAQPTYEGTIPLGASAVTTRAQVQQIVQYLFTHYFHAHAYHLVHRNCNHFTETLATALIQRDKFLINLPKNNNDDSYTSSDTKKNDEKLNAKLKLKSYPAHLNRLANTGGNLIGHDDDIVPCQVVAEARQAVLCGGLPSSQFSNSASSSSSSKQTASSSSSLFNNKKSSSNQKKELTEKQKAILAKIKGGGGSSST